MKGTNMNKTIFAILLCLASMPAAATDRVGNLMDAIVMLNKAEFKDCNGCWNTCYTPAAKLSN